MERTAEIDGRAVYSYTSWEPRQGQTISGCVTYRLWSSTIEPIIAIAGFTDIEVEAWALPMTPSAAFRFTLDGFYSHGSRVTFLPALMDVPIGNRIEIMREALTECSKELDSYPRPHIANLVAMRP
ncbi:hypothetical protein IU427_25085 [Nocardia beijingensis]|uniref:hypothetical protein n=1 Tax=Nocardia beijingensis TaxID=95162 RepID=UPI001893F6C4|nr:hypothetical protein [Nocardia beijingensis]MBF6468419.1 hypothetical protein [Nocardia beijingensis]